MARVLLIRHCQSTGQSFESPLSDLGRTQAIALAAWLPDRGIDRIVSSPFERAIDTVAPFAAAAGIEIEIDDRLGERRLTNIRYPTLPESFDAIRAAMEDRALRYQTGESGLEVTARAWPALADALAGSNAVTALASHGQLSSHLLREIDGTSGYDLWTAMTTPDVFEIWRDEDGLHFNRLWVER